MCNGKYVMSSRNLAGAISLLLLLLISNPLYADYAASGSQSPENPVSTGVNPVYTITVTNLNPFSARSPEITIFLGAVNVTESFTNTSGCVLDGPTYYCPTLEATATDSFQFQWNAVPLEGDYPLTFNVICIECISDIVSFVTTVLTPTELPELPSLTESEEEVYESLQSACSNLIADEDEARSVGENNLREACLALDGADAATLESVVSQLTPKQGPAQGSSSIEANNRQFDNINSRMSALRSGASGISAAGLKLQYKDLSLPGSLFAFDSDTPSGGSAGEDEPLLIGRLGVFVNGSVSFGDKSSSGNELGFDVDTTGLTFGMDYRFSDKFIAGGAIGYVNNETEFDSSSGNMDVDGYTISAYSTYYHDENSYLDAIISIGWNDFSNSRAVSVGSGFPAVNVKGDSEGQEYSFSIGGGYDFYRNSLSFGPLVRINYIKADIDSYAESTSTGFELDYDSQDIESLTSTLGGQLSYAISTSKGIFSPQLIFEWAHEFKDDSRFITARFLYDSSSSPLSFNLQTDDPERDYFNLGAGLTATFAAGKSAFIFYETNLQRDDINLDTISAGLRLTFY